MSLKASAANFSVSSALRTTSASLSSMPLTGGMSTGDGISSMTLSSMACTPLFLKAEPHSMGWISPAMVRWRRPAMMSFSDSSPSSR